MTMRVPMPMYMLPPWVDVRCFYPLGALSRRTFVHYGIGRPVGRSSASSSSCSYQRVKYWPWR